MRRVESTAVETLPPPQPDAYVPAVPSAPADSAPPLLEGPRHVPRAGDLTTAWRILTGIGWLGIVVMLAATWNASRQLGLPTWWLGPLDHQRPAYIILLPFVAPAVVLTAVGNRVRYVPWIGVLGATATAAIGLGDLGRVRGLGVVELIGAAAALLVSIASFSGMYRRVSTDETDRIDTDGVDTAGYDMAGDDTAGTSALSIDGSVDADLPSG
jgi:hypothetical protein